MSANGTGPQAAGAGRRVLALTGATGYVGGLVRDAYCAAGWDVVALQRKVGRGGSGAAGAARRFVLGEPVSPDLLAGVDVLVHGAYDLGLTRPGDIERVNVEGTRLLFEAAVAAGVGRIVLVSSMSAYWGTDQVYGGAKLRCEELARAAGGVSVRLGLVYGTTAAEGDTGGGMAGSLLALTRLPMTPLVGARSYQYTVHEADVAAGLLALGVTADPPAEPIGLAHPQRVPFRELLDGFGRAGGAHPRFVPVPWRPVYAAMRVAEAARIPLPLRSDSLLGLARPAGFVPQVERWPAYGVELSPFTP